MLVDSNSQQPHCVMQRRLLLLHSTKLLLLVLSRYPIYESAPTTILVKAESKRSMIYLPLVDWMESVGLNERRSKGRPLPQTDAVFPSPRAVEPASEMCRTSREFLRRPWQPREAAKRQPQQVEWGGRTFHRHQPLRPYQNAGLPTLRRQGRHGVPRIVFEYWREGSMRRQLRAAAAVAIAPRVSWITSPQEPKSCHSR
jgi:hypothetical protein